MSENEMVYSRADGGQVKVNVGGLADLVDPALWPGYRKTVVTRARRIDGPFTVETSEGPLKCQDGYLAVDARGYPYPIATEEFELIYEPA